MYIIFYAVVFKILVYHMLYSIFESLFFVNHFKSYDMKWNGMMWYDFTTLIVGMQYLLPILLLLLLPRWLIRCITNEFSTFAFIMF